MQGFDLLLTLIIWLVVDAALGYVRRERYNPTPLLERVYHAVLGGMARNLNRSERTPKALMVRGFVVLLLAFALAFALVAGLHHAPLPQLVMPLVVVLGISGTGFLTCGKLPDVPTQRALNNAPLLTPDDATRRRLAVQAMLNILTNNLVLPFVLIATNHAYAVPFWAALSWFLRQFGRDGQQAPFAASAAFLAALPLLVAQFITSVLLAVACLFSPKFNVLRVLSAPFRQSERAGLLMGGLPLLVVAFGFNKTLGGPRFHVDGTSITNPWVGPKNTTAKLDETDLKALRYAAFVTVLLTDIVFILIN